MIGTFRIELLEVDRSKRDPQNVLFVVVSISDYQFYKLENTNDILFQFYSRNQSIYYIDKRYFRSFSHKIIFANVQYFFKWSSKNLPKCKIKCK